MRGDIPDVARQRHVVGGRRLDVRLVRALLGGDILRGQQPQPRRVALGQFVPQPRSLPLRLGPLQFAFCHLQLREHILAPQLDEQFAWLHAVALARMQPRDESALSRRQARAAAGLHRAGPRVHGHGLDEPA